jgi:hypothetical protein
MGVAAWLGAGAGGHHFDARSFRQPVFSQRMLEPGCYRCSSRLPAELFQPFPGPRKSPTAAGIRGTDLGVRKRSDNDAAHRSPRAHSSPKHETQQIYCSLFGSRFNSLVSLARRKVGILFACHSRQLDDSNRLTQPEPLTLWTQRRRSVASGAQSPLLPCATPARTQGSHREGTYEQG